MHIHILGIAGTFMGGVAKIAAALGHQVTGQDAAIYPPMSTQLEQAGIQLIEGYEARQLHNAPDLVIVGNAMTRGKPVVEYLLNSSIPYTSGPAWLAEQLLMKRWVIAVAGTHGKTTTSSMLTWILETAGLNPGYLIGGIPGNFTTSARHTDSNYFVIEADEYDTAFFDKRAKFIHYRPKTLILNNLEFDHADIYPDLSAIQTQFHHLIRTVASEGQILYPVDNMNIAATLKRGCWSKQITLGGASADWQSRLLTEDGSQFEVIYQGQKQGTVAASFFGHHNVENALAAIAASAQVGVNVASAIHALSDFKLPARRMQLRGVVNDISVFDDFAHHPTAIATTLAGLRARVGTARIIVILELRSYTMRSGFYKDTLMSALAPYADGVHLYCAEQQDWDIATLLQQASMPAAQYTSVDALVDTLGSEMAPGDQIVVMSNGGFEDIHTKLLDILHSKT